MSVVDILKQPEYRSLTSTKPHPPSSSVAQPGQRLQASEVVDLTEDGESGDEGGREGAGPALVSRGSPARLRPLPAFAPPVGGWECPACLVQNKPAEEKCVACGSSKAGQVTGQVTLAGSRDSMPQLKPLAQFAPPKDSWSCETCLVQNKAANGKCVACGGLRPGEGEGGGGGGGGGGGSDTQPSFQFGVQGGLQLGKGLLPKFPLSATPSNQTLPPGGTGQQPSQPPLSQAKDKQSASDKVPLKPLAQFAPPAGAWACDTCMVSNKPGDGVCVACGGARSGGVARSGGAAPSKTALPTAVTFGPGGGLKLGGGLQLGQGLKLGGGGPTTTGGQLKFGAAPLGVGAQPGAVKPGSAPQPEASAPLGVRPAVFGAQGGLKVGTGGLGTGLFGENREQKSDSASGTGTGLRLSGEPGLAVQPPSGQALGMAPDGVRTGDLWEGAAETKAPSEGGPTQATGQLDM